MSHPITVEYARAHNLVLAEGKTKIVVKRTDDEYYVDIISKDDITAGDGAKHDLIQGKAVSATQTTCNVFRLLKECGVPVAFNEQVSDVTFRAPHCRMLPYEVVVRREAHGSYLKRMPGMPKGHLFPQLLVEFFLKTNGKKWKEHDLPCDDPLLQYEYIFGDIALYEPSKPIHSQNPFLMLKEKEVFTQSNESVFFKEMGRLAKRAFLILEKAWQLEGRRLVDFKVEFGLTKDGTLLLADVIDNDSWRVVEEGAYIDKQVYRDGGGIDEVAEKYRRVAEITRNFRVPFQQVLVWGGSEKDKTDLIVKELESFCGIEYDNYPEVAGWYLRFVPVTCSMHKEPIRGIDELNRLVQERPDTVVIAYIGRSNGAGPTLSASTTVPVITVPTNFKDFPDDVWSSLRTPSNVPVATILEPSNAALAALQILALRSPLLYMFLREKIEKRTVNTIQL